MSRPRTDRALRATAAAVAFAALVGGCSTDMYYDRRDTITAGSGDALAANMVEQMVDPWPRYSNNKNIPFNGERMQRAVECYRKDRVTTPVDIDPTTAEAGQPQQQVQSFQCVGQMTSGSAAPVGGLAVGGTALGGTPAIAPVAPAATAAK
jgi:hypothetical protein